ncbi:hypothetical protein BDK51DRAFT_39192 [Blyttiomyces helicus]|uniref:F-box domain-containing protein n=1 Tax=Blyttiomyces helicus TaxID=388810 RepID=A0A4P9VXQ4_9FUNG|nr:hypothetical protein BDK51DRAFT_39192 [Blyttiomyces helicus]|eukprot:RKO83068.1 hypothetical protein BDK51DRAFT_39192 [Blyttiomyces helicus]
MSPDPEESPEPPDVDPPTPRPSAAPINAGSLPTEILLHICFFLLPHASTLPPSKGALTSANTVHPLVLVNRRWAAAFVFPLWRTLSVPPGRVAQVADTLWRPNAATFPYGKFVRGVDLARASGEDLFARRILMTAPPPPLVDLRLRGIRSDAEFGRALGAVAATLRRLDLVDCTGGEWLAEIGRAAGELTHLDLSGTGAVADATVGAFADASRVGLRVLRVARCGRITDKMVGCVQWRCRNLEVLDVGGTRIGLAGIVAFTEAAAGLRWLGIERLAVARMDAPQLAGALARLPGLVHLEVANTAAGCMAVSEAARDNGLPHLVSLRIGHDEFLEEPTCRMLFARLPNLQTLSFPSHTLLPDRSLRAILSRCRTLKSLDLPDVDVSERLALLSPSTLFALPGCCPKLEFARLVGHLVSDDNGGAEDLRRGVGGAGETVRGAEEG